MPGTLVMQVLRRRAHRRRPARRIPDQLPVFSFSLAPEGLHHREAIPRRDAQRSWAGRFATVLVRGRMGQNEAIGPAYEQARLCGNQSFCTDIRSVPAPRPTPALDALCQRHTAFPTFLALLTATAGYRPSIRLDLLGRDDLVLARAYDRWQARWGDPRRAFVSGDPSPRRSRVAP